jgi:uracil-DNA glycosylase family 4
MPMYSSADRQTIATRKGSRSTIVNPFSTGRSRISAHASCGAGALAAQALLQQDVAISQLRGKVHQYNIASTVGRDYHPAYLLRSPTAKAKSWQDLMLAVRYRVRLCCARRLVG